ncbi:MAG: polysaccharide deacetylase family protein, partial [Candidatus Brocadiaceae bacterium]
LPPNPVVITFDDGYRDNRTVALPLLREAGVTADFFVCPGNVEQRRPFWWDRLAFCVRTSPRSSAALDYPRRMELDLGSAEAKEQSRRRLLRVVKRTPGLDVEKLLELLQEATGVAPDEAEAAEELVMSWDDVRALREAGMGIGSHTWTHPVLTMVDGEEATDQLTRSRAALEERLGEPVRTLSYPVGSFSEQTRERALAAGYELAYSYGGGVSRLPGADLLSLRRLAVERHVTMPYLKTVLAAPLLN